MLKICNEPCLPYKIIGKVIDKYIDYNIEDTIYVGKKEIITFIYKDVKYEAQIKYTENYVLWCFKEMGEVHVL